MTPAEEAFLTHYKGKGWNSLIKDAWLTAWAQSREAEWKVVRSYMTVLFGEQGTQFVDNLKKPGHVTHKSFA